MSATFTSASSLPGRPRLRVDTIENHRPLHQRDPFTSELVDRWLQIFRDTVDGAWTGPHATAAKKRAAGMAWAMALRFLGKGVWRPAERRLGREPTRRSHARPLGGPRSEDGHPAWGSVGGGNGGARKASRVRPASPSLVTLSSSSPR